MSVKSGWQKIIIVFVAILFVVCCVVFGVWKEVFGAKLCVKGDKEKRVYIDRDDNFADFISFLTTDSIIENPSGLDGKTNNYSSCYDLAYLTSIALENETFRKIFGTKTYDVTLPSGKKMHFFNKHKLVISDNNVIGGKTGYTKKAGRTLITVFNQNGRELVVVTMDAYNDWNLHRSLVNAYDE